MEIDFKNENMKFGATEGKITRFSGKKGNLECTYYHDTNHTKEMFFHLIGFPPRSNKASNAGSGSNNFSKFSGNTDNRVVAQVQSGASAPPSTEEHSLTGKEETLFNTLTADQYQ